MLQRNTKKTKEEAQNEIWERFPYINIISEYTGANNKVTLHCNNCGHEWETTARSVASSKRGCPQCGVKNATKERSLKYFLSKFDDSEFELLEFEDCMHVKVRCKKCGTIRYTNANNIYRFGCKHCAMIAHGEKTRSNTEDFIRKAKLVHGDKYDYSQVKYYNCKTPVKIICPKHGEFWQNANHHLHGEGCPECSFSHGERDVMFFLDAWGIPYKSQYVYFTPNRNYRFDFYIETPNKNFIIEYNGKQHYESIDYFGGDSRLKEQLKRDEDLRNYCKETNIRLFEIKYDSNIKQEMLVILKELLPALQEIADDETDENGEFCDENTVLTNSISQGELVV